MALIVATCSGALNGSVQADLLTFGKPRAWMCIFGTMYF